ncbi:unnamed protein product [Cochlearia groenlandica]
MASAEPPNQTAPVMAALPLKKGKPKLEDPKVAIKQILGVVEGLHQKIVPNQQILITRSQGDGRTAPDQGVGTTIARQMSAPELSNNKEDTYIPKLRRNLRLLNEDVIKLQNLRSVVADEVAKHIDPLMKMLEIVESVSADRLTKTMKKDLEEINKKIFNLMYLVPLLPSNNKKAGSSDSEEGDKINNGRGIVCLPAIHANEEDLKKRAVFRYVQEEFKKLSDDRKIFLLSFAVFPENQEVNRTMLMYWWIGENILKTSQKGVVLSDKEKPENVVKEVLEDFTKLKLIDPVQNKRKFKPNCYKMPPFVHSSVVLISKEIGLFDIYETGKRPTMKQSSLNKVCLVEESSSQEQAKAKRMPNADLIETVFNVSERFPDFTFKWFAEDAKKKFGPLSKPVYKALKVFYLGRWERTATRHIEVENPELMKYLKHMTKLRLLSFQGISRIEKLDDAVCKLDKLIILDLRACYNLEKLPEKIDSLKALVYLDITDCYMIDCMPKKLSWIDNLEVLKGFVVSDATDDETVCTLADLVHLKKLRKLSITINKGDIGVTQLIDAIKNFEKLEKLKVAWGCINVYKKDAHSAGLVQKMVERTATYLRLNQSTAKTEPEISKKSQKNKKPRELPKTLKKLDLQCFPEEKLPGWLEPEKLLYLEKLYIKGGTQLTRLGKLPDMATQCSVTVLRLKFLPRLQVEWRDLTERYFPKLKFLDKYQSPQVSLCPCDGNGIWRKNV